MGGEKEDGLGLSLSLGMSCPQNNLKNNDFISPSTPPFLLPFMHNHQISAGKSCTSLQPFAFFFLFLSLGRNDKSYLSREISYLCLHQGRLIMLYFWDATYFEPCVNERLKLRALGGCLFFFHLILNACSESDTNTLLNLIGSNF